MLAADEKTEGAQLGALGARVRCIYLTSSVYIHSGELMTGTTRAQTEEGAWEHRLVGKASKTYTCHFGSSYDTLVAWCHQTLPLWKNCIYT